MKYLRIRSLPKKKKNSQGFPVRANQRRRSRNRNRALHAVSLSYRPYASVLIAARPTPIEDQKQKSLARPSLHLVKSTDPFGWIIRYTCRGTLGRLIMSQYYDTASHDVAWYVVGYMHACGSAFEFGGFGRICLCLLELLCHQHSKAVQ